MPRLPRIQFPGAVYHIVTRGDGRRRVFHDDGHYGGSNFLKRLLAMASGEDKGANRRLHRRMTPVTVDAILDV